MNQKLQQAIAAARSGNNKKAQYLLTQTLQENPEETQAWYLLSLLVDSPEKQITYLNRVLELNPAHEKAQEKLAALTAVPPTIDIAPDSLSLAEQENSDLLPGWMADDVPDTYFETPSTIEEIADTGAESEDDELPDWLQESVVDEWALEEESETAVFPPTEEDQPIAQAETSAEKTDTPPATMAKAPAEATKTPPVKKQKSASPKNNQGSSLNLVLTVLVILALLVAAFLIYLLITL